MTEDHEEVLRFVKRARGLLGWAEECEEGQRIVKRGRKCEEGQRIRMGKECGVWQRIVQSVRNVY